MRGRWAISLTWETVPKHQKGGYEGDTRKDNNLPDPFSKPEFLLPNDALC